MNCEGANIDAGELRARVRLALARWSAEISSVTLRVELDEDGLSCSVRLRVRDADSIAFAHRAASAEDALSSVLGRATRLLERMSWKRAVGVVSVESRPTTPRRGGRPPGGPAWSG